MAEHPSEADKLGPYGPPLKPKKKLAIVLLALFIVWLAVLWVMYFTTVR